MGLLDVPGYSRPQSDGKYAQVINVSRVYSSLMSTPAAAISQAITDANALYTASGIVRDVLLESGVWSLEDAVQLKSGVRVRGVSRAAVTVRPTGLKPAFQFIGTNTNRLTDFALSDMTIDGVNQTGTYTYTAKGVYVMYTQRCAFERLTINNAYATALGLDYPKTTTVDDCLFFNAGRGMGGTQYGGNGLGSLIGATDVEEMKVSRCHATSCANIGFLIEAQLLTQYNARGYQFIECTSRDNGFHGFVDAGAYGAIFTNCIATKNTGSGFVIGQGDKPASTPCPPGYGGIISACLSSHNALGGILIDNSLVSQLGTDGYKIIGCHISNNGHSGIALVGGAFGNYNLLTVRGNTIVSNGTAGAYAGISLSGTSGASNLDIDGNTLVGNSNVGITFGSPVANGRVRSYAPTDATQTTGIKLSSAAVCTGVTFGGHYIGSGGTPANIATAALSTGCSVETPARGWTRNSGAPAIAAPKGTVYQRTDGSAGSLLYVNTDGAVAWTAFA